MNESQDITNTFQELYLNEKYQEAINLLLKHKDSYPKGVFHYNLGTLYLKQNEVAPARYNLEKAIADGYFTANVQKNHQNVMSRIVQEDIETSNQLIDKVLTKTASYPFEVYLVITLIFALIFTFIVHKFKIKNFIAIILFVLMASVPIAYK